MAAHQAITIDWWARRRSIFDLFTSQFVIDEASRGDHVFAKRRLDVLSELRPARITNDIVELGRKLVRDGALPDNAAIDALHVATAAGNKMDYLLTWNCRHLANAILFRRVRNVCERAGFECPVICTPEELMED